MKAKVATAAQMLAGQSGVVLGVEGGHVLLGRLESLGIRPGKRIRKVSSCYQHYRCHAVRGWVRYSDRLPHGQSNINEDGLNCVS